MAALLFWPATLRADDVSIAAKLQGHLVALDGGALKPLDAATLKGVKYWAIYNSASWCAPCRIFTPQLVAFYASFKKSHPDFEVVLLSGDLNDKAMTMYMKSEKMPWPAIAFADTDRVDVRHYFHGAIPDLVLVDADGHLLFNSIQGDQSVGPEVTLAALRKLVRD